MKYLLAILLTLLSYSAHAKEWTAVQGDILAVTVFSQANITGVQALGKNWPVKHIKTGVWQAWIGIDLKKKAKKYWVIWHTSNKHDIKDLLKVKAGVFRISRIEVPKNMSNFDAKAVHRIRSDQAAIKASYDIDVPMIPDFSKVYVPVHGIESTPFGAQRYVNGQARSPHSGIDIAAAKGTAVVAPLAGKVLLVENMFLNGHVMVIGHGSGLVSVYAHLSHFDVQQGEWVKAGQKIAEVGSTGRSTGAHLHWGVCYQHARINPESLLRLAKSPEKIAE
ncbi:MAG: M23 family metallopeptidase [Mariprofundaceae bacterium]|nr:M23 family metallopeptidase [Mariprofundaceae bacterium]